MNSIGLSSCYVTINNYKQKLVNEHTIKIREFFSEQIFKNCGKSKIEKKNQYKLATLEEIVDSKCLPAGYSTSVSPLPNACDHCKKKLDDGEVLVCGHGYHFECYQKLEYSPNILTTEEKEGENVEDITNEDDEKTEEIEINKSQQVYVAFINALNQIDTW
ncbi:15538_t:CDS:2 [Funneliformis caledonium]|uniref:15538_t:CDS:1 n=1 Tax=Funneliformis caledonium TaxID=1117310 RepID=A0A9N9FPN1_9GLOM|nr:15538_t:CDS:2 [Funneliformis caledonium]